MTAMTTPPELQLPWESTREEDGRFHRILRNMLAALAALAVVVPLLPVSQLAREKTAEAPSHLARVILEKKVLPAPAPPVVKPRPRPVAVKSREKPPPPEKPRETRQPRDKQARARDVAAVSGVLAFRDELADMRDSLDVDSLNQTGMRRGEASAAAVERSVISSAARVQSGGIKTAMVSTDAGGPALSGRATTTVQSTIASNVREERQSPSTRLGGRSDESIRRVMDRNKGAIFAIYNRALRVDPLLEGKLVFEMVIESSGAIADIKLLSSELADEELTRKILSRIRLIRFEPEEVITTRVNYSFDFLPYT